MQQITYLPRTGKTNSKIRRYAARGELMARKAAEEANRGRTTEEIWDSIFKPVDETDVLANLLIGIKDMPDVERKQPRLRKPIMSDSSVTARG
ncbi:hypothetical protein MJ634_002450 [Providencia rettgeri]|uniref:hypothetical protein n=1 Tax=Providencia rettgeri TaxID=587 RepID=UPI001B38B448|nr:hypothetical protein [Providencia rettgeri]MBQ0608023.1 hypothetical protein [Providencia rettgeri]MCJ2221918.1 hypothetical protein [Providencia rettgeri]